MGAKQPERRSDCPAAFTLDILGDRWTMLIVRDLLLHGRQRYSDFLEAGEGIATNILADRLARLERWGIIESSLDPTNRRAKLYRPTRKGIELAPLLVDMLIWGASHDPNTGASRAWLRRAKRDRQAMVDEIVEGLEAAG